MQEQRQRQLQRQQAEQLQQQHAAAQQRKQRQSLALETGDESKQGQRVWIIPEFDPGPAESDYLIESVRDALPEYNCQLATDSTEPMTEERIHAMLLGVDVDELEEGGGDE